jgi:hypothetical protein
MQLMRNVATWHAGRSVWYFNRNLVEMEFNWTITEPEGTAAAHVLRMQPVEHGIA